MRVFTRPGRGTFAITTTARFSDTEESVGSLDARLSRRAAGRVVRIARDRHAGVVARLSRAADGVSTVDRIARDHAHQPGHARGRIVDVARSAFERRLAALASLDVVYERTGTSE